MIVFCISEQDFLREKAFPLLRGCSEFLLDWLVEDNEGNLVTNPSTSPEHYFITPSRERACVTFGAAMDIAIIREVFSAITSAAEVITAFVR